MRNLYIVLIDHCVLHGSVNLGMSKELLYLFDWHSFVDGACCQSPSELVRVYFCDPQPLSQLPQSYLYTTDLQPIERAE